MSPRLLALVSLLLLAGGVALVWRATVALGALERESDRLGAEGREAGRSFVETLQGEHATRQLEAFDRRLSVAIERASVRRTRLYGVLAIVAGALGLLAARGLARIADEIEEHHREVADLAPRRPPRP